jgi:hypothetical protein
MGVAESAFAVVPELGFIRCVGRNPDAQIMATARLDGTEL